MELGSTGQHCEANTPMAPAHSASVSCSLRPAARKASKPAQAQPGTSRGCTGQPHVRVDLLHRLLQHQACMLVQHTENMRMQRQPSLYWWPQGDIHLLHEHLAGLAVRPTICKAPAHRLAPGGSPCCPICWHQPHVSPSAARAHQVKCGISHSACEEFPAP